jgi:hypothetical protein
VINRAKYVTVRLKYDEALARLTGQREEDLTLPRGQSFTAVLLFLLDAYPEIEERYPPGRLGILLDGQAPGPLDRIERDAVVEFTAVEAPPAIPDEGIDLADPQFEEMLEAVADDVRLPVIDLLDDEESPEARALAEYTRGFYELDEEETRRPDSEIAQLGEAILAELVTESEWRLFVLLMARHGSPKALEVLRAIDEMPLEPWQDVWICKAMDDCARLYALKSGGERTWPLVRDISVPRSDPCPCGSGKKYKHCCER